MRKSDATRTKISFGTRRMDRWRTATTDPSEWNSNGKPIRSLDAVRRRTALARPATKVRGSAEPAGSTKAYATTSGGSRIAVREAPLKAQPKAKPARPAGQTRGNRNPTNRRPNKRGRTKLDKHQ